METSSGDLEEQTGSGDLGEQTKSGDLEEQNDDTDNPPGMDCMHLSSEKNIKQQPQMPEQMTSDMQTLRRLRDDQTETKEVRSDEFLRGETCFKLTTDCSKDNVGAILSTLQEGQENGVLETQSFLEEDDEDDPMEDQPQADKSRGGEEDG